MTTWDERRYADDSWGWQVTKVKLEPEASAALLKYARPPYKVPLWHLVSNGTRLLMKILQAKDGEVIAVPGGKGVTVTVSRA